MMWKVIILTLGVLSINGCFGIPLIQDCTLVDLGDDVEALTCGSETVTRFKNGTLIDVQYFANETLSVLQVGNDRSACYLYRSVPLPDGIDFAQGSETDVREEANAETSAAIVALVPKCAGRVVYEMVPETSATTTGRKKRWCRKTYFCCYKYIRSWGIVYRYRYCRYLRYC